MKKILLVLVFAAFGLIAFAQETSVWSLTYDMSIPMGKTKDFIEKTSFRGIALEGRKFIDNNFSLGGSVGWCVFYEKKDKITTELENITLTGTHYRYLNTYPIYVNAAYYLNEGSYIRPYLAANVGLIVTDYRNDIGLYTIQETPAKFGFAPELGILIETEGGTGFTLNMKYNMGTETSDTEAYSSLGINVGIIWVY
jgi:outer membrane protein